MSFDSMLMSNLLSNCVHILSQNSKARRFGRRGEIIVQMWYELNGDFNYESVINNEQNDYGA